jgi:hypothetical protein
MGVLLVILTEAIGHEEVIQNLKAIGRRLNNPKPAFREVARDYMYIAEKTITSEGRRGGGSWKPNTAKWDRRKWAQGYGLRMMRKTDRLFRSLTIERHPDQYLKITNTTIDFGSKVPYSHRQNVVRPLMKVVPGDIKYWGEILLSYSLAPIKPLGRAGTVARSKRVKR